MSAQLVVTPANLGRRLESVACAWLPQVPRGRLLKWLRRGTLRVNGRRAAPSLRLATGDVLCLRVRLAPEGAIDPSAVGADAVDGAAKAHLSPTFRGAPAAGPARPRRRLPPPVVVYEDGDLLVVDKPANLASHGGIGHADDSLAARLLDYLDAHDAAPGERVGLAQRLDAGVSGLVPCGKHAAALKVLMGPPHGPKLEKTYLAVVAGVPAALRGSICLPLRSTDAPRGDVPKVVVDRISGKPARTDYVVLAQWAKRSLLALRLHTGRTHQIRAHLRALGHPLLGDPRYGHAEANDWARASFGVRRPLLHAAHLQLAHPVTGEPLVFRSPAPDEIARLCGGKSDWSLADEGPCGAQMFLSQ